MKKQLLSGLLCLLLLLSLMLSACNNDKGKTEQTTEGGENETAVAGDPLVEMLPANIDMEGRSIKIATAYIDQHGFGLEDYSGDPIEDACYERNMYIEERFDVILEYAEGDGYSLLQTAHLSQSPEYDFVYPNPFNLGTMMTQGMLTDMNSLKYLNLDQEWWNQSQVTGWNCNGHLYVAAGDSTITGQAFSGVVYNIGEYSRFGFEENLYQTVYDGKWTMEMLQTMVKQGSIDVDGSDEGDFYGLCYWDNITYTFMYGMGQNILAQNADGKFELAFETSKLTDIATALSNLLYEPNSMIVHSNTGNAGLPDSAMYTTFADGKGLFMTFDIGSQWGLLRDIEFDIGYLPLPKLDEAQKDYYSICSAGCIGIPYFVKDADQASIILEAITICSYQDLKPEFFNSILMGRLSENQEDYDMLEYLHATKFYDVGWPLDTTRVASNMMYNVVISIGSTSAVTTYMKGNYNALQAIVTAANEIQ